jgi:acetylglutamate kinase
MYLRQFASIDQNQFAVIKVGGAVVDEELKELTESLTFLQQVGLCPVVVHGGGPQLNKRLQDIGEVPRYVDGMRVTTPDTLEVALQVFHEENARLIETLEGMGTRARPVLTGVFEAEYLDEAKYGYVGRVTGVRTNNIESSIRAGQLPILVSVGYTRTGQALNINADVAAGALARTIQPMKTVYLNSTGGLPDADGRVISSLSMEDYDELMAQPWMREGTKLKVQEIKHLLDDLPMSSSVAVTRAADLPRELFTVGGAGTILRKGEKLLRFETPDEFEKEMEREDLRDLLETAFGKPLVPGYFDSVFVDKELDSIYISASLRAAAVITKPNHVDEDDGTVTELDVPYMDKFAVSPNARGEGLADMLFSRIQKDHPKMFWRAKANNPINRWYFQKSDGAYRHGDWTVFWYGIEDFSEAKALIETALAMPETFRRSHLNPEADEDPEISSA